MGFHFSEESCRWFAEKMRPIALEMPDWYFIKNFRDRLVDYAKETKSIEIKHYLCKRKTWGLGRPRIDIVKLRALLDKHSILGDLRENILSESVSINLAKEKWMKDNPRNAPINVRFPNYQDGAFGDAMSDYLNKVYKFV